MEQMRRMSSAAGLAVLTLLTLLLVTPAAAAATADRMSSTGPSTVPTGSEPMALATTGLDITVPVVIGLSTLVLGMAVVAWAFLRTGSAQQHR